MSHARTLEGLCDRAEITDLIHAYCFHFDRADPDKVAALFTGDAEIDYGPDVDTVVGPAALHAMVTKGATTLFAATSHHVSNVTVAFETRDRATSNCYLYAWHRYREDGGESELWGQYDHVFHRTGAGWRIARLSLSAAGMRDFHRGRMHPVPRILGP